MLGRAAGECAESPYVCGPISYGDNASSRARNTPCAFPWDLHASIHHHTIALDAVHGFIADHKQITAPKWSMGAEALLAVGMV